MTKEEFRALCDKGIVILDGATGSNLRKAGMPVGVCTEKWITENPEPLMGLQKAYAAAGTQILYAPTFSANRMNLAAHGLQDQVEPLNRQLVGISRAAVGDACLIAGDLTTTSQSLFVYEEVFEAYKEQIQVLDAAGVDLLVAETMLGADETMAAVDAANAVSTLPILCSLTTQADGSLYMGGDIYSAAEQLEAMGADAVGLNCSVGPEQLETVVRNLRARISIPLLVKPNAGMPVMTARGEAIYSMKPEEFAEHMKALVDAGANLVGGCCGTSPAYIEALAKILNPRDGVSSSFLIS